MFNFPLSIMTHTVMYNITIVLFVPVDFVISDQQPTSPVVKVMVGRDGTPAENQQLSMIVKR